MPIIPTDAKQPFLIRIQELGQEYSAPSLFYLPPEARTLVTKITCLCPISSPVLLDLIKNVGCMDKYTIYKIHRIGSITVMLKSCSLAYREVVQHNSCKRSLWNQCNANKDNCDIELTREAHQFTVKPNLMP